MEFGLFVDQPNLELKKGVQVHEDTELSFKNETVEQYLSNLKLEIIMDEEGSNGINTYKSKSHITINLNEGTVISRTLQNSGTKSMPTENRTANT